MRTDGSSPARIEEMVTHPGSASAGAALLERAVKLAKEWNMTGQVGLCPSDKDAYEAYSAMDLEATMGYMKLDPATSRRWSEHEGEWRIKKHAGKDYVG